MIVFKNNTRGLVLLGSLVISVFLSLMLVANFIQHETMIKQVEARMRNQQAFYAAESGVERAISELRMNVDWKPGENGNAAVDNEVVQYAENGAQTTIGTYSLQVEDGPVYQGWQTRWIKSVAESAGGAGVRKATRIIYARVITDNPAKFLVSTMGDIKIYSGASIDAKVLAKNIDFIVNTQQASGQDIFVNDDIYYLKGGGVTGADQTAVHVCAACRFYESPSITFIGVDLNRYANLAAILAPRGEGLYLEGNQTIDLDRLDLLAPFGYSGLFQPKIIYVNGQANVKGTFSYSLLIVSSQNLNIVGSIVSNSSSEVTPQIGLFAKRDVIIPSSAVTTGGELTVEGFLVADGDGDSQGRVFAESNPDFNRLEFNGSITARGKGASAVDLNAFKFRRYQFNAELNANRLIPFVPFIVNKIVWYEAKPDDPFPPH